MRKFISFNFFLLGFALWLGSGSVSAVSSSDWRAGRIIDDYVFTNVNAMSVQDVQAFLNSKTPSCDVNGTQMVYDSTYGDTVTRATYGSRRNNPAPFTCLKDYYEVPKTTPGPGVPANNYGGGPIPSGAKSAAQLIMEAAQAYRINPQVLLVTLQKEQSLLTDDWPFKRQLWFAMGAQCPDSGPGGSANCDEDYIGFSLQMREGAELLRYYLDNMTKSWWPYKKPYQSNSVLFNPNTSCGSTNVYIETMATAALYTYTPYQPNSGSLAHKLSGGRYYSTAYPDCGAYGNLNFWKLYWDWFGNPIGPDYSWQIDSFSYAGGDNLVAQGQTETFTLKARNTSRHPWYNHGNNPTRLGTWQPANRASPLLNGGNRFATLQENVINPGEIGTFTFQATPQQQGTYIEAMNLVAENAAWMAWPGLSPTIVVTNAYQWQIDDIIYDKGTGVMNPGTTQLITLKARNTGNVTWSKSSGAPIRLGTWQPGRVSSVGSGWLSTTRVVDMNENTVAPGQVAGFQFYVKMPSGGNYYERMNLVAEGQTWFNDPGLTLYLHGNTYSWQPLWHAHSTGTANIPRNTEFTMTIKVKNTGEMAWKKADPFSVRLGTVNPLNRGSAFYQSSWIKDTRPATHSEDTVLPGQEGTFTFTMKTPNTTGPWHEYFSLVAEGVLWFNNPGFNIYVNVVP